MDTPRLMHSLGDLQSELPEPVAPGSPPPERNPPADSDDAARWVLIGLGVVLMAAAFAGVLALGLVPGAAACVPVFLVGARFVILGAFFHDDLRLSRGLSLRVWKRRRR